MPQFECQCDAVIYNRNVFAGHWGQSFKYFFKHKSGKNKLLSIQDEMLAGLSQICYWRI